MSAFQSGLAVDNCRKPVRAFDLFCGVGGSSWGARLAGAEIVGGIDIDPIAMRTFADNFPTAGFTSPGAAEDIDLDELRRAVGAVDLLIASPECTDHTHAKGSAPRREDSRRKALQVMRYAEALECRWLLRGERSQHGGVVGIRGVRQWATGARLSDPSAEVERGGLRRTAIAAAPVPIG